MFQKVEKSWIPFGEMGTQTTLDRMAKIVNDSIHLPIVRDHAIRITKGMDGRNRTAQASAIRSWILRNMVFIRDPEQVEMIHTPENMLMQYQEKGAIYGDCDDMAVLAASLGKSIGIKARFVVLGFNGKNSPFSHVYTLLDCGNEMYLAVDSNSGYPWLKSSVTRKAWRNV